MGGPALPKKPSLLHSEDLDPKEVLADPLVALERTTKHSAIKCSHEVREQLVRIGLFPSTDLPGVERGVAEIFKAYREAGRPSTFSPDISPETRSHLAVVQRFVRLLVTLNLVRFVPYTDWHVDRDMSPFAHLQAHLERQYGEGVERLIHLHKGSGDGSAMAALKKHPQNGRFEHIGFGDALFFLIEDLLTQFIRPEKKNQPEVQEFVRVSAFRLRHPLRKLWFKNADQNVIARMTSKRETFDYNIIYALLAHPGKGEVSRGEASGWLSHAFRFGKKRKGGVISAVEFDDDYEYKRRLGVAPTRLMLEYLGFPERLISGRELSQLQSEKTRYGQLINSLSCLRKTVERVKKAVFIFESELVQFADIVGNNNVMTTIKTPAQLLSAVEEEIEKREGKVYLPEMDKMPPLQAMKDRILKKIPPATCPPLDLPAAWNELLESEIAEFPELIDKKTRAEAPHDYDQLIEEKIQNARAICS